MVLHDFSVAILTYGDRYKFLSKVLDNLLCQDFLSIYVFCNGLSVDVKTLLIESYVDDRICFLFSDINLGSAGGYYHLLKHVYRHDKSDYLLILDDDNIVQTNFLAQLGELRLDDNELLFFNRPDRSAPLRAFQTKNPRLLLGPERGFLGHSIVGYWLNSYAYVEGHLLAAPYGGLMISSSVFKSGVLPDEKLFLYGDDYDYTYRLTSRSGFKIRFMESPLVNDLEKSFHLKSNDKFILFSNRYASSNDDQLFYSVRNQVYLSFRDNGGSLIGVLNLFIFAPIYVFQFLMLGQLKRAKLFSGAVVRGLKMFFEEIQ